jgi:hypothetical protein
MTAVGGASLITGCVLLAIAESNAASLKSDKDGALWTKTRDDKYNSVKPLRIAGGVTLGVGAALAAVGVVFLVKNPGAEQASESARFGVRLSAQEIQWIGRF